MSAVETAARRTERAQSRRHQGACAWKLSTEPALGFAAPLFTNAPTPTSVKGEDLSAAGAYIDAEVRVGDVLEASAPRGDFTLRPGDGPVVLLSAGIGATPVLAMLHALAAARSLREVWWIYGARNGGEHPFATETRALLAALPRSHSHICYTSPGLADRAEVYFDAHGRLNLRALQDLGAAPEADFYICGPTAFMGDRTADLAVWGVAARRIHTEVFGTGPSMTPGVAAAAHRAPHLPEGRPARDRWSPSRAAASMSAGIQRSTASSNAPRRAMCPCDTRRCAM